MHKRPHGVTGTCVGTSGRIRRTAVPAGWAVCGAGRGPARGRREVLCVSAVSGTPPARGGSGSAGRRGHRTGVPGRPRGPRGRGAAPAPPPERGPGRVRAGLDQVVRAVRVRW
ncbi:hypothetical protein SFR_0995 [Streptomyces sp. FR-008]|nr:hypothetical protein SFR_0995 [Streptomyces sp. FR-008]